MQTASLPLLKTRPFMSYFFPERHLLLADVLDANVIVVHEGAVRKGDDNLFVTKWIILLLGLGEEYIQCGVFVAKPKK
jgi:hypothetical protein